MSKDSRNQKWVEAFNKGFASAHSGADAGAEIANKITVKGDKKLSKLGEDIDFAEDNVPPSVKKAAAKTPRTPRAPKAPKMPAPESAPPKAAAPKAAPKAKSAPSSKASKAFDQFYAYRRYKRYVKLCEKRGIELPGGIGNLSVESTAADLESAISAMENEFDAASGDDSIRTDLNLALDFVESGFMHPKVYGRFHHFNLTGLSSAVDKNWDYLADEIEEVILKYNAFFHRPVEFRLASKLFVLARTLNEYNRASGDRQAAYNSGDIQVPSDFPM